MNNYITRKIKSKKNKKYNYEYFDKDDNKVKKKTINKFLTGIYIPPAYNNVKINKNKQAKVLAIGYDDKGRSQYTYNKKTINKNKKSKYKKLIDFGENYDKITRKINTDFNGPDSKDKQISLILKLIIDCNFRVGNEKYKNDNNSYGVSTLEKKHLKFKKNKLIIDFIGKKGVKNTCNVKNKKMIQILKKQYDNNNINNHIFYFTNSDNKIQVIKSTDVNNYLKNLGNYTTKNFRTWNANIELIKNILKSRDNNISNSIKNVALKLHHTPPVCKKNYIDPKLIGYFENNPTEFYSFFKGGNINQKYTKFLNLKY